jgi:hypothetical protein
MGGDRSRLINGAHFVPLKVTNWVQKLVDLHVKDIIRLDGIPDVIKSRLPFHLKVLGESANTYGHKVELQYMLPLVDRWSAENDHPDPGRHVENVCARFQGEVVWHLAS